MSHPKLSVFLLRAALVVVTAIPLTAQAQPLYRLTDLNDLNSRGSVAYDINNAGQIVGYEDLGRGTVATIFHPGSSNTRIGGTMTTALAINNRPGGGLIVGQALLPGDGRRVFRAVLFCCGGRTIDLSTSALGSSGSIAVDVNDSGRIVGSAYNRRDPYMVATRFRDHNPFDPGTNLQIGVSPSDAKAINNSGVTVGVSEFSNRNTATIFDFGGRTSTLGRPAVS